MRKNSTRARQCRDWEPLLWVGEVGIFPIPLSLSSLVLLSDYGVNSGCNPSLLSTLNFCLIGGVAHDLLHCTLKLYLKHRHFDQTLGGLYLKRFSL